MPSRDPVPCVVVLMDGDAEAARWPLPDARHADLSVVDHLARLQLAARRRGLEVRVRGAPARLTELMDLAGLSGIVTSIDRA